MATARSISRIFPGNSDVATAPGPSSAPEPHTDLKAAQACGVSENSDREPNTP